MNMPVKQEPSMLSRLASRARGAMGGGQQQPQNNGQNNQQGGGWGGQGNNQGNGNNQQQQPNQQQRPGNDQQSRMGQNDPSNFQGNRGPATMQGDDGGEGGLDFLNGIFDNHQQTDGPPAFALDDKTLDAGMSSLDFIKSMPAEMQGKLQAMDPATLEIMQYIGRQSYRASMQHGALVGGKYHDIREQHSGKGFGSKVRDIMLEDGMMSDDSIPEAARPLFAGITKRLKAQYPDATPKELTQATREWFAKMNGKLNPGTGNQNPGDRQSQQPTEQNYDDFFGSAPPDLREVPQD